MSTPQIATPVTLKNVDVLTTTGAERIDLPLAQNASGAAVLKINNSVISGGTSGDILVVNMDGTLGQEATPPPGPGAVVPASITTTQPNDFIFPNSLITDAGSQPTNTADVVAYDSAKAAGIAITGYSIDASTSTDGILMYLGHNGSNNRQLMMVDSAATLTAEPVIRFHLNSTAPSIDCFRADLTGAGTAPLTLGNTTNGIIISGQAVIPATSNQIVLGTTHTVTISSTTPTASRTYTVPDAGANANIVLDQGAYTIAGQITYSLPQIQPNSTNASATGTISPVANVENYLYTLAGSITVNGPSTPLYDGQTVTFRFQQAAAGGPYTVTFASGSGNFSYGTTITSYTMTSTASAFDLVGCKWNATANRWNIVSISQGF